MTIKVLVNGAFGRMGQITAKTISTLADFELVGQTGREYDLSQAIKDSKADVVVDFTNAEAVLANTTAILEAHARPVIGTSGLKQEHIATLKALAKREKMGGIIVPNFSIGAVLMMKCAKEVVNYFPHVEIIEMHHDQKLDSPSGTAIRTAEILAEAKTIQSHEAVHETIAGARGANCKGVPIHAIRLPGLLAHQKIMFGSTGETLTISHDSLNRECFMSGVALACKKVMELDHLAYGLEEIL